MPTASVNSANGNGVSQLSLSMVSARKVEKEKHVSTGFKTSRYASDAFSKERFQKERKMSEEEKLRMNAKSKGDKSTAIAVAEKRTKEVGESDRSENDLVSTDASSEYLEDLKEMSCLVDAKLKDFDYLLEAEMARYDNDSDDGKANSVNLKRVSDIYLSFLDKKRELGKAIHLLGMGSHSSPANLPTTAIQVNINNSNPEKAPEGGSIVS